MSTRPKYTNLIDSLHRIFNPRSYQLYLIFAFIWLSLCQLGFFLLQESIGTKTLSSIQNQLRQELDFSNFQYLSRSIADFQNSGSIRCAVVKMTAPSTIDILDLRYMNDSLTCQLPGWLLDGSHISAELKSLNGDTYSFSFVNDNGSIFQLALWSFRVFGIILIFMGYWNMKQQLKIEAAKVESKIRYADALNSVSKKLAHDIRSPLSALNMLTNSLSSLESSQKQIIGSVVSRINGIADDLLLQSKLNKESEIGITSLQNISVPYKECEIVQTLELLIKEKQLEYKNSPLVNIQSRYYSIPKNTKVFLSSHDISRVFSNLINNAVEAILDNGDIFLEVNMRNEVLVISITDFGKGIPENVLENLKISPQSHGKGTTGNGIGLKSAIDALESTGGKIDIISKLNVGTKVIITLPRHS